MSVDRQQRNALSLKVIAQCRLDFEITGDTSITVTGNGIVVCDATKKARITENKSMNGTNTVYRIDLNTL